MGARSLEAPLTCPNCNVALRPPRLGLSVSSYCGLCGYGVSQEERELPPRLQPPSASELVRRWLGAVIILALLLGPPLMILPMAPPNARSLFYWWLFIALAYLSITNLWTPTYDHGDMGWKKRRRQFDNPFKHQEIMDNPLSQTDHLNRHLSFLYLVFLPGKVVGGALVGTYRFLKARETN